MTKEMLEKRNDFAEKMQSIVDLAKAEDRAMTEEEIAEFDSCEKEIKNIDETNDRIERINTMEKVEDRIVVTEMTQEEKDVKAFANYIRTTIVNDDPTDVNMTKSDNGAVIPTTIVAKIIEKVAEISPLYARATKYNAKGTLLIPYEDASDGSITVAYGTEFSDMLSTSNKFATISLTGFLYGALTKISKSLLNNSDFALVDWVVDKIGSKMASFIEDECLNGTDSKISGIAGSYDSTNMAKTLASKDGVTADELIDLQALIIDAYQGNACWIMNSATKKAIRKLKDGEGRYLLVNDFASGSGDMLLGKPVFVSENVSALGTNSKNVIFYGDFSGLAIKEAETLEVQILNELYAAQHAVGVVAWGELDAKVEDAQKIAVAVTPGA